jgi:hypothetical protein
MLIIEKRQQPEIEETKVVSRICLGLARTLSDGKWGEKS